MPLCTCSNVLFTGLRQYTYIEILKASYDYISPFLLILYNRLLNTGEYPRAWGEGIITPVFKKGNVNDANNYRGLTLINILAMVYSQLLLNRMTKWAKIYEKSSKINLASKKENLLPIVFISYRQLFQKY